MDDEAPIHRQGPRLDELTAANSRLTAFARNPISHHVRFDTSPPPYRSRDNTPSDDEPESEHNGDTEESLRALRESAEEMDQALKEDPFAGLNAEERRSAIAWAEGLMQRGLAREAEEKRKEDEWWASRTYSTKSVFSADAPLPVEILKRGNAPTNEVQDDTILAAPRRGRGRPRASIAAQKRGTNPARQSSRINKSVQPEQQRVLRRSSRLAAKSGARSLTAVAPPVDRRVPKSRRSSKRGRRSLRPE